MVEVSLHAYNFSIESEDVQKVVATRQVEVHSRRLVVGVLAPLSSPARGHQEPTSNVRKHRGNRLKEWERVVEALDAAGDREGKKNEKKTVAEFAPSSIFSLSLSGSFGYPPPTELSGPSLPREVAARPARRQDGSDGGSWHYISHICYVDGKPRSPLTPPHAHDHRDTTGGQILPRSRHPLYQYLFFSKFLINQIQKNSFNIFCRFHDKFSFCVLEEFIDVVKIIKSRLEDDGRSHRRVEWSSAGAVSPVVDGGRRQRPQRQQLLKTAVFSFVGASVRHFSPTFQYLSLWFTVLVSVPRDCHLGQSGRIVDICDLYEVRKLQPRFVRDDLASRVMDIQAMQSMDWLFKKERIYLLAQFWQQNNCGKSVCRRPQLSGMCGAGYRDYVTASDKFYNKISPMYQRFVPNFIST
ncbi:hypothetical protein J6590_034812 [Homalodisca vitripennis]|nr:hypothetical protein J6590_034812 [Homalodisca vitripennis]